MKNNMLQDTTVVDQNVSARANESRKLSVQCTRDDYARIPIVDR